MDDYILGHLKSLYGMNPDIPHMAFQFPRLPPGLPHPVFKIHDSARVNMPRGAEGISDRLQEFQLSYQKHASGLLNMNSRATLPGHPLYTSQESITSLKAENNKLLKENADLRKRLEKQPS